MEMDPAIQIIVAVAMGVLTIVWNQQRSVGNLRREFLEANKELRREFHEANVQMRRELQEAKTELRGAVAGNGERLARIEGHLGIGVTAARTSRSGGTKTHTDEESPARHGATR